MAFGSLASAQNPTPVSKIELLQPPQNRAVTPGWRVEPVGHAIQEFCETARCKIAETLAERRPTGTPVKVKGLGFRAPACYMLDGVDVFKNTSRKKH